MKEIIYYFYYVIKLVKFKGKIVKSLLLIIMGIFFVCIIDKRPGKYAFRVNELHTSSFDLESFPPEGKVDSVLKLIEEELDRRENVSQ